MLLGSDQVFQFINKLSFKTVPDVLCKNPYLQGKLHDRRRHKRHVFVPLLLQLFRGANFNCHVASGLFALFMEDVFDGDNHREPVLR